MTVFAEAVEGADIVVVCLPDGHYQPFLSELLVRRMRPGSIVVDPWNRVADEAGMGVRLAVGLGASASAASSISARKRMRLPLSPATTCFLFSVGLRFG